MAHRFTRPVLAASAALLLSLAAVPAFAQRAPGGSYLESCTNVRAYGDRVTAECRRVDGSWSRAEIDAGRCRDGIANSNGQLTCNGGRAYSDRGREWDRWRDERPRYSDRDREWSRDRDRFEGYGSSAPYYPGYGRY